MQIHRPSKRQFVTYLVAQKPQTPNVSVDATLVFGWFGLGDALSFSRYMDLMMGSDSPTRRNKMKATKRRRNAANDTNR